MESNKSNFSHQVLTVSKFRSLDTIQDPTFGQEVARLQWSGPEPSWGVLLIPLNELQSLRKLLDLFASLESEVLLD